jgi:glycosyltransferase involved in cell wall biosynthesis/LmbE family N-acetylglucosaminyl deacetylase
VPAAREWEWSRTVVTAVEEVHRGDPIDVIEGSETAMLHIARRLPAVPMIIRLHGEPYTFFKFTPDLGLTPALRLGRVAQRAAFRRACLLVSPSTAHRDEVVAELGPAGPPAAVVPNVIARSLLAAAQEPADSALPGGDIPGPVVLFAGRLERRKGVPALLRAVARVTAAVPDAHFVLAGGRHSTLSEADLAALLRELPDPSRVHLLGHVAWGELLGWYHRAAVCVLPSYYETFGMAALEPMAFGLPVVAFKAGALPEVVGDGVSGLLVPPGDVGALAAALVRRLTDADLRRTLGANARDRAADRFLLEDHFGENLDLYHWAADRGRPPAAHLVFSPHLDDAAYSCGGTIAAARRRGEPVRVVTTFAAEGLLARSAFARHMLRKWSAAGAPERRVEDQKALRRLGVTGVEQWDLPDAPTRADADGRPLYATYDELKGEPAPQDGPLAEVLLRRVEQRVAEEPGPCRLYFPIGLGGHVDHVLLYRVGLRLRAAGHDVRFYEEWPYAADYQPRPQPAPWLPETADIPLDEKQAACVEYRSQLAGIGGTEAAARDRIAAYARRVGDGRPAERLWSLTRKVAAELLDHPDRAGPPFTPLTRAPRLRDFARVADMVRRHDLDTVLPAGDGLCVDMGCGTGRHRGTVEARGYRWLGVDRVGSTDGSVIEGDSRRFPVESGTAAAAISWQVMEYVDQPEDVLREAYRVLEPGGVFCGSVSFLEPAHGPNQHGISPGLLVRLLRQHGFADVRVLPGMSGFALSLRDLLRRLVHPRTGELARPLTAAWLLPLAGVRFLASWAAYRLGFGTGHAMEWLTRTMPAEFAGHVRFVARKPGREARCTSAS